MGRIPLALTSAFILTGCGAKEEETPVPDETVEEQPLEEIEETPSAEDEIVEDDQIPDGMARSPLTGEIEDKEIAKQRPLAIMLPTDKAAQPQYGIGQAGVLYERGRYVPPDGDHRGLAGDREAW